MQHGFWQMAATATVTEAELLTICWLHPRAVVGSFPSTPVLWWHPYSTATVCNFFPNIKSSNLCAVVWTVFIQNGFSNCVGCFTSCVPVKTFFLTKNSNLGFTLPLETHLCVLQSLIWLMSWGDQFAQKVSIYASYPDIIINSSPCPFICVLVWMINYMICLLNERSNLAEPRTCMQLPRVFILG
jgi:hypothetical protein